MYIDSTQGVGCLFSLHVEVATEVTVKDLTQDMLNCGYTGHICSEEKDEIIRYVRGASALCTVSELNVCIYVAKKYTPNP